MTEVNFMPVWRKRAKISQWELAQMLRISQKDISDYETGKVLPPIDIRLTIAKILGKDVRDIFPY